MPLLALNMKVKLATTIQSNIVDLLPLPVVDLWKEKDVEFNYSCLLILQYAWDYQFTLSLPIQILPQINKEDPFLLQAKVYYPTTEMHLFPYHKYKEERMERVERVELLLQVLK